MKKVILLIIATFMFSQAFTQGRPTWTVKLPKAKNNTYIYVCETAIASMERDARNQAIARVFQSTAMRLGVPFESEKVFEAVQKGTDLQTISRQYNIPIYKVCEYTERVNNNYKVFVLCQVAAQGNVIPQFDYSFQDCNVLPDNNWVALAKSAVIPGLGQMGKRHYGEGTLTLIGEMALVGGALTTYYMGKDKLDLMTSGTLNYDDYIATQKDYNNLQTANRALWISAAVLYAYNLYRAYTVTPRYKRSLTFEPLLIPMPNGITTSISLTFNF